MDLDDDLDFTTNDGRIKPKVIAQIHEFYISGVIKSPDNYIECFDTIRQARRDDVIKIYLNTYGGDMFTGIQFMRALRETEAHVICSDFPLC